MNRFATPQQTSKRLTTDPTAAALAAHLGAT
jgi:hypothetical protein